MDDRVTEWLAECTDGRVSSHTITMLSAYTNWLKRDGGALSAPSRNDVLEEAAKVVDEHGEAWGLSYRSMTDNIAAAIRARKDQTDG